MTSDNAQTALDDTYNILTNGGNDIDEQCVSNVVDILEDVVNMQLPDRQVM